MTRRRRSWDQVWRRPTWVLVLAVLMVGCSITGLGIAAWQVTAGESPVYGALVALGAALVAMAALMGMFDEEDEDDQSRHR